MEVLGIEQETGLTGSAIAPLSVSEFTQHVKLALEVPFQQVWLKGEISNYKPAASGHVYFSLKDAQSCVSVALFKWSKAKNLHLLKDGMQVLLSGKVSVYAPRGSYQVTAEQVEPLGVGALALAFAQLKEKLQQEGLFRLEYKKPLPKFPKKIVVITSTTGAVVQDMVQILKRRAPFVDILVIPSLVQGGAAVDGLLRALDTAELYGLGDVIILARGGGSLEDLWCFNDELLARRIFTAKIPIISAIGHEVDFTISDFVADMRAPTPSAAAELVSQYWVQVPAQQQQGVERLIMGMQKILGHQRMLLEHHAQRLSSPFVRAQDQLQQRAQRTDESVYRLLQAWKVRLQCFRSQWERACGTLDNLSPLKVLARGYALVKDEQGHVVVSCHAIGAGDTVKVTFYDGDKTLQVL